MQNQFDYHNRDYPDGAANFMTVENTLKLIDAGVPLDINDYDFCYLRRQSDKTDKWILNKTIIILFYSFAVDVIPALSFADILRLLPARMAADDGEELELKWIIRDDIEKGRIFSFGYGPLGRNTMAVGFENSNPVDALSELLMYAVDRCPETIISRINIKS